MKTCASCSNPVSDTARFCEHCGTSQLLAAAQPAEVRTPCATAAPQERSAFTVVGAVAATLFGLVALALGVTHYSAPAKSSIQRVAKHERAKVSSSHITRKHIVAYTTTKLKPAPPTATPEPTPTPDGHPGCGGAMYFRGKAVDAFNANAYQSAYDDAVAGLNRVDSCDDQMQIALKGMLLGSKALSEHHLSSGNSADDINQAITLLASCQTQPAFYGQSIGAHCESEEETLISYKTHWEMAQYEQ